MKVVLWLSFFLVVAVLTYLPYKGRDFKDVTWRKVVGLSVLFFISSSVLLALAHSELNVRTNLAIMISFSATTFLWFLSPKIVRLFGKYPKTYLENKVNETKFLVEVEPKTMTIKYFEVLFQQAGFLFIFLKFWKVFHQTKGYYSLWPLLLSFTWGIFCSCMLNGLFFILL